jgi:hypothetical protein
MGYTHYWRRFKDFTPEQWDAIVKETRAIVDSYGELLAGWNGEDSPIVDENMISFNGRDPECCESFIIKRWLKDYGLRAEALTSEFPPRGFFDFCKTRMLTYDSAVVEVMAALKRIAPEAISISSDGGPGVFPGYQPDHLDGLQSE